MGSYTFLAVLRTVQEMPERYKVFEKSSKLKITGREVKNIGEAKRALESTVA